MLLGKALGLSKRPLNHRPALLVWVQGCRTNDLINVFYAVNFEDKSANAHGHAHGHGHGSHAAAAAQQAKAKDILDANDKNAMMR